MLKNIKLKFEKLEELEGEFIYTYLMKFSKKEIYFRLDEIKTVFFTRMIIKNDEFDKLTLFIILEDDYAVRLQKKENIILFFKSCKENNPEINENLSPAEIIRSFAGPIMTYSAQRFILFEDTPCPTEKHDLQFIKQQIYKNLTK